MPSINSIKASLTIRVFENLKYPTPSSAGHAKDIMLSDADIPEGRRGLVIPGDGNAIVAGRSRRGLSVDVGEVQVFHAKAIPGIYLHIAEHVILGMDGDFLVLGPVGEKTPGHRVGLKHPRE